ncbi:MAG TPA: hypothetical protein IAC28_01255 [Candidatus Aphodovivens excrementavium]|nr:hypothetical protein [Candidatus Aphodovivens excrementavium]
MWGSFALSVCILVALVYLPGSILFRAFRFPRVDSLALAPVVTVVGITLLGIVYPRIGITCTWVSVGAPLVAVGVMGGIAVLFMANRGAKVCPGGKGVDSKAFGKAKANRRPRSLSFDAWCLLAYVAVGVIVSTVFFVGTLDGPDSYVQEYDNLHHLGITRAFVESGNWTSLDDTLYPLPQEANVNPLPAKTFYPKGWNCLAAFPVSVLGVSVALAGNAVNFVLIAVVLPVSMFSFLRVVFYRRRPVIAFGALCPLAFTAFPWAFLIFGPLYPNLLAFAIMPALMGSFVRLLSPGVPRRRRVCEAVVFVLGLAALVLAQPNAVFTLGVVLAPYIVWRAAHLADLFKAGSSAMWRLRATLFGLLAVALIAGVWAFCFSLPMLSAVVWYDWPAFMGVPEAVLGSLTFTFRMGVPQIALAVFVLVGIVFSLRKRRYLWLSFSFLLPCFIYIVDVTQNGMFKHFVAGFWYTDSLRIAAMVAFSAIPLAALGLQTAFVWVRWLARRACRRRGVSAGGVARGLSAGIGVAIAAVFAVAVFLPIGSQENAEPQRGANPQENAAGLRTAFGAVSKSLTEMNSFNHPRVYDLKEEQFVRMVQRFLPYDAMVINFPDDGSAFAYAQNGLNAYYRYVWTYGSDTETKESKVIRRGLNRIAEDEEVRQAVEKIGARYLLLLDKGMSSRDGRWLFSYFNRGDTWSGIETIDDNTPGFTVVAAQDDMRLYRIDGM